VGAGGDLGRRSALVLGCRGARVMLADHVQASDLLAQSVELLSGEGVACTSVVCDVTDEDSADAAVAAATQDGPLSILVNAAEVMLRRRVTDTSLGEWQKVIDVNLTGTWLLNRAAVRTMASAGWKRIVNFASVYAERVGRSPNPPTTPRRPRSAISPARSPASSVRWAST
jgi:gluconate 5-dehydrogenase